MKCYFFRLQDALPVLWVLEQTKQTNQAQISGILLLTLKLCAFNFYCLIVILNLIFSWLLGKEYLISKFRGGSLNEFTRVHDPFPLFFSFSFILGTGNKEKECVIDISEFCLRTHFRQHYYYVFAFCISFNWTLILTNNIFIVLKS